MKRLNCEARDGWEKELESQGVLWATTENGPYWNESMSQPVYYELTQKEQESLEHAGNTIHHMCIEVVTWLIEEADDETRNYWFDVFCIPENARQKIIDSWENDEWSMYGRFDFVMQNGVPKLLEYNADTPTTLIETAISQWSWYVDQNMGKQFFQFNELHEALVRHWSDMYAMNDLPEKVHFAAFEQVDDFATVCYMAEVAAEAGIDAVTIPMAQIGWNGEQFTNPNEDNIDACFKLYPWEWMYEDAYGDHLSAEGTRWIEAPWKMLLSNKAILAILWERFPECEYLVPCYIGDDIVLMEPNLTGKWVVKPLLSREGCNISIIDYDDMTEIVQTGGEYSLTDVVLQQYIEWEPIDGKYPMLGVWMVCNDAVALGIREDDTCITQNNSRFIPHVVKKD